MNSQNTKSNKTPPLLAVGIALIAIGFWGELYALIPIGVLLVVLQIILLKNKKEKKTQNTPAQPTFTAPPASTPFEYDAETGRTVNRKEAEHRLLQAQYGQFSAAPHADHSSMMRQAQAEIRNLRNIRYARSELTGRTLSDTVIWHSRKGACSSVVQVIRQGNLRYPDLSDRELSERILADHDLMQSLARSLEWEKRTEIRWN